MTPPHLPPELISDILDTFLHLSPSHALRTPNLARFARVNRTWNAASIPLLYRNIYLDSRTREGVLDAFEANPNLPGRVRHLTLSGGNLDSEGFKRLLDVLRACTGVTHLSYHCFDPSFLEDLTDFVATTWPGLRYLRADQSHALYSLLARLPDLETLIATYIEFPAPGVPSPPSRISTPPPPSSGRSSPSPSHPIRPTFRLKRFDSGSSPHPSNFHLLTSSSTTSLTSLDLPISSQTSQDLEAFRGLRRLTLTLAERYIRPLPAVVGAVGMGGREDAHCLRRLKRLLAHAGRSGVPLSTLEIYDPPYALTEPFKPEVFEETDVLAAVPKGVKELDLATLDIGLGYIKRAFEREGEEKVCEGVEVVVLSRAKRDEEGAEEMRSLLGRRGVEVRWV
ncbi:Erythrocyte membrane protein 1 [Rhodotorula toruloides ATCC 204091]|uniref:Erythrocyte membrane protein 1 n=2 Tax=Rhodotorula toruloides TaxID=5286 RepID=A0A2T0AJH7_RHOTO|nr:Erythrocyte membrane protein 1 [Rhodotorula toruloides ATCC 204091]PRQ78149.1 erythrocyte membrane protein 1 [Rhodotorula toruloides]